MLTRTVCKQNHFLDLAAESLTEGRIKRLTEACTSYNWRVRQKQNKNEERRQKNIVAH